MTSLEHARISSRRNGWLSLFGATIIVASLIYSYLSLSKLQQNVIEKRSEIKSLALEKKEIAEALREAQIKLSNIEKTQNSILDTLVQVADERNIDILDRSIDWPFVRSELIELDPGDRKNVLMNALLLSWKSIPFSMGQEGIVNGFDSPRFLRYVLSTVDVDVSTVPGQRLSDTLMNSFKKTNNPKPGDLVFFEGQVGSFGFILLNVGQTDSDHVGIGTLQKSAPLQIIKMQNINTRYFPLIGYFSVNYPDE